MYLTPELAERCVQAQREAALERAEARQRVARSWLSTLASPPVEDTDEQRTGFAGGPLAMAALEKFDK